MKLPLGYRYSSLYAGLRPEPKDDLALIVSDRVASAAALFTTNRVRAAPVKVARRHLSRSGGRARAVLVNAGNANCATRNGERVARACCAALARELKVPVSQVLPASTGVIGVEMDASLIVERLPALVEGLSAAGLPGVAGAILTTDTVPKTASTEVKLKGGTVCIAGVTKGSGMIHPRMATTLAFVVSDVEIAPMALWETLVPAVELSYHRLSVDGDTSTNDMVLALANGAANVGLDRGEQKVFGAALTEVLQELARQIAADGEGARKRITVEVTGAVNDGAAVQIARSIANSALVKTAVAGADPNWGRVLVAAGYAGVPFDPAKVDVYLQGVRVCSGGTAAEFSEKEMAEKLGARECVIRLVIRGRGSGAARFWSCDLTEDYIRINAEYRT